MPRPTKKKTVKATKPARPQLPTDNVAAPEPVPAKPSLTARWWFPAKQNAVARPMPTLTAATAKHESSNRLVGDTLWLGGVVLTVYLTLSLVSFRMVDPSWSRSIERVGNVGNFGGLLGAYLADIVYYLFGLSAWWGIAAAAVALYRNFRPFAEKGVRPYVRWIAGAGLAVMLLCSPVLEAALFGQSLSGSLPLGAGGWVGGAFGGLFADLIGRTMSLLILFIGGLLALSLLVQISWLDFAEGVGIRLERMAKASWAAVFGGDEPAAVAPVVAAKTVPKAEMETVEQPETAMVPPKGSSSNRKAALTVSLPVLQPNRAFRQPEKTVEATADHSGYRLPELSRLRSPEGEPVGIDEAQLRETAGRIEAKLAEFGIQVQVVSATAGPVITRYEIEPAKGVKGSQIVNLSKDLARSMAIQAVRVVETIPGKSTMGIEVPNAVRQDVLLQEILNADVFADAESKLTVALGKDIAGVPVVGDLAKMPHLLVAGMTGSGKSVGVNAMIMSMLYKAKPDEVRFIMIDPKMLELSIYEGIPHLLCPVVTDMKSAGNALNWCVAEMEKRYRLLSHVGVRNLAGYNDKIQAAKQAQKPLPNPFSLNPDDPEPLEKLPQIVVVIDELADLMMTEKKAVETQIARLAQKARAAGIHMIIATQRPSVDVITGLIKANIPTRMAFTVQSRIDSRTILDQMGAEDLLKYGDSLFLQPGQAEPIRLQSPFVDDNEVYNVVDFIKEQAEPNYVEGILSGEAALETNGFISPDAGNGGDEMFDQAVQFILSSRKTSISSLQRHLRIGYNRAANLMQSLEDAGVVSPPESDGKRQILARSDS